MKTSFLFKNTLKLAFVAGSLFFASCGEDNTILDTTDEDLDLIDNTITVNSTNAGTGERTLDITETAGSNVSVIVKFTKEKDSMDRLYVTKTESGSTEGSVAYNIDPQDILNLNTKLDGSIDLEKDQEDEFTFTLDFPAPSLNNGTVQYVLWTTEGRGDYRDITNDNAFEDRSTYAVITITAGTKADLNGIKEFEQTILAAPRADGKSKSFISIFNNQTYLINDGDETAAFWDFGYHYGPSKGASFYSTEDYPKIFSKNGQTGLSVAEFSGASENVNKFYFKLSDKTVSEFDAITKKSDLDYIEKSNSQRIQGLNENQIVEFVDQYGNKGLIKVINIKGTFNANDSITFDIKAQVNAEPFNL